MIESMRGDILSAEAEALVNTVNCVGVMGRGIALQFRKAFPENFRFYETACQRKEVKPGSMLVFETGFLTLPRYIINFPTKRHWKGKSKLADIDVGLKALLAEVTERNIRSIAIPPLGCGLGGLNWADVRPRIVDAFAQAPNVSVLLFEPEGAPAPEAMAKATKNPEMTAGRAVLVELMSRYLTAVMDPFITLLEIHKLLYFMQEAGEGLRLRYEKAPYGPYSTNLRHLLSLVEGHFITGIGTLPATDRGTASSWAIVSRDRQSFGGSMRRWHFACCDPKVPSAQLHQGPGAGDYLRGTCQAEQGGTTYRQFGRFSIRGHRAAAAEAEVKHTLNDLDLQTRRRTFRMPKAAVAPLLPRGADHVCPCDRSACGG